MTARIDLDRRGDIAVVTIANPARRNALTVQLWRALRDTMVSLDAASDCRCVVLRGAGDTFVAGADISEFEQERSSREQITRYHEECVGPCVAAVLECGVPTVAMIRGACMGGGLEIAAACDIRIAAPDVRFGIPIARMGFPLAFGEAELLFKLYGRNVAAELLLEGRIYDVEAALRVGLVQRVVAAEALEAEAMATAARIAAGSPLAARRNKEQLLRLLRDWSPVTAAERARSYDFADSRDYRIGFEAFLRKETPVFRGE
ncbi:MAG: enoyl-CoA hydratase/isomerase family protein [Rhodovulum sp.]|nr:enoyl-CoA hydratase/isomerase family protein [Rhodovulum sp.]